MAETEPVTFTVESVGGGLYVVDGVSIGGSRGIGGRPGFEAGGGQG